MSDARKKQKAPLPDNLPPRGLSRVAAAAYVGVSATTFDVLVRDQTMPRPAKLRGRVLWDRRALDRALDAIFNAAAELLPADPLAAAPEFAL